MAETNGNEPFMTVREMVTEIRADLKEVKERQVTKDDFEAQKKDYESRIRSLEKWRYGIPATGLIAVLTAVASQLFK
jgi:predicted  nucleic acid-binding Zn-ribbon protein